ncbi:MAG: PDZ domain-containing protein [Sulfurimonas sp.]
MFRLFVALNLLLINLSLAEESIDSCKFKVIDSKSIVNQTLQIPLQNNQRLVFSTTTPNAKILKHDPYLSLYIIEDKKSFKYPFQVNKNRTSAVFCVDNKSVIEGKILKRQVGLESFATFSKQVSSPSLLLSSCCALEGIVTERGIIQREYIERFLKVKKVTYGDFGIRVATVNSAVVVISSNPFLKGNLFKKGDIILELDGKKVKDSATFMRDVLFSEIGSLHKVKIKRANELLTISAKTQNRVGGGYLSDIFLEFLGISFNEELHVTKIEQSARGYGLKAGDKLLRVNGVDVKKLQEISQILDNPKKPVNLLLQREQFQFFVKVN